jgi:hypothetical protein
MLYNDIHQTFCLLYYREDLEKVSGSDRILDPELSGIAGCNIYISGEHVYERFKNAARTLVENPSVNIYIVPKSYSPIYSILGEMPILWCKRNKWFLTVYKTNPTEPRLVLDGPACGLRVEMFNDLCIKIPIEVNSRGKSERLLLDLGNTF